MAPDPVLLGLRGSRDTSVFARPRWNAPEPASSRRQGPGSASTCPSATFHELDPSSRWRTPNWSAGAGLLRHGAQLAVDATLTSPVARDGKARHAGVTVPGDALQRATARKRTTTYTEFAQNRRCRLVVVAMETSGLWGSEAVLAHAKARGTPPWLRPTTVGAYIHRWAAPPRHRATQHAFAASFLDPLVSALDTVDRFTIWWRKPATPIPLPL